MNPTTASQILLQVPLNLIPAQDDALLFSKKLQNLLPGKLRQLYRDLGIPATIHITVQCSETIPEPAFYVNTFPIPIQVYLRKFSAYNKGLFSAADVAYLAHKAVFNNREQLITPEIAQKVADEYKSGWVSEVPIDVLTPFLKKLARHGIPFGEATALFSKIYAARQEQAWLANQTEIIIAVLASNQFTIIQHGLIPQEELAGEDLPGQQEPALVKDLKERLFSDLGFPLEDLFIKQDEGLEEGSFYLKINSMRSNPELLSYAAPGTDFSRLIYEQIKAHLPVLLSYRTVDKLLQMLGKEFPMAARHAIEALSTHLLTNILRKLLEERVSIRDLYLIINTLLEINGKFAPPPGDDDEFILPFGANLIRLRDPQKGCMPEDYVNYVRSHLGKALVNPYLLREKELHLVTIAPAVLEELLSEDGLSIERQKDLIEAIDKVVSEITGEPINVPPAVGIITSFASRALLKHIIQHDLSAIPVFSKEEIPDQVVIQLRGTISLI